MRSIINKKQTTSNSGSFCINKRNEQNKDLIANGFNEFYVNIGPALAGKIPTGKGDPITYIKNGITNTIFLRPVNEAEVEDILKSLKNAGPGRDGISARIVKLSYKYFLVPLVHICTLSLIHDVFPNELKIAKVIPLYKGGNARLFYQLSCPFIQSFQKYMSAWCITDCLNLLNWTTSCTVYNLDLESDILHLLP